MPYGPRSATRARSATRPCNLAIGVRCLRQKEILGLWIEQSEGAKIWAAGHKRTQEPRHPGYSDCCRRRPKGLSRSHREHLFGRRGSTCIVHLIRCSMQFASWKERNANAKDSKPIYQAEDSGQVITHLTKDGRPVLLEIFDGKRFVDSLAHAIESVSKGGKKSPK